MKRILAAVALVFLLAAAVPAQDRSQARGNETRPVQAGLRAWGQFVFHGGGARYEGEAEVSPLVPSSFLNGGCPDFTAETLGSLYLTGFISFFPQSPNQCAQFQFSTVPSQAAGFSGTFLSDGPEGVLLERVVYVWDRQTGKQLWGMNTKACGYVEKKIEIPFNDFASGEVTVQIVIFYAVPYHSRFHRDPCKETR